jgi:acylphosphatase
MIARRLVIRGRVQGVGYRDAMVDAAHASGVRGWVRNRRDGSVEAHLQGRAEDVEAIVAWARRGPPAARVSDVRVDEASADAALASFAMRATE